MRKNYILTYMTEFIVLLVSLLIYKLAAELPGSGFSEYAMSVRLVAVLAPLFALGSGVGIPRYVAHEGHGDDDTADNYLLGGLICSGLFCILFCIAVYFLKEIFSCLVFGSAKYGFLIWPCLVFVFGQVFLGLLYGYFRGRLQMVPANILQLLVSGLMPLLAFAFFASSCALLLVGRGALAMSVCLVFLIPLALKARIKISSLPSDTLKLLKYGIGRVPGDFSLAAIFILPASYVAHTAGIEKAGAVAFGISLLNMVGYMFSPVGVILLPHASRLMAKGEAMELREGVKRLMFVALILVICGIAAFEFAADHILRFYFGSEIGYASNVVRVCMLGALPLVVFYLLRSIIDAWHFKPVNSRNLLISLAVMSLLMLLGYLTNRNSETWSSLYLILSLFVLGGLTARDAVRILVSINAKEQRKSTFHW